MQKLRKIEWLILHGRFQSYKRNLRNTKQPNFGKKISGERKCLLSHASSSEIVGEPHPPPHIPISWNRKDPTCALVWNGYLLFRFHSILGLAPIFSFLYSRDPENRSLRFQTVIVSSMISSTFHQLRIESTKGRKHWWDGQQLDPALRRAAATRYERTSCR